MRARVLAALLRACVALRAAQALAHCAGVGGAVPQHASARLCCAELAAECPGPAQPNAEHSAPPACCPRGPQHLAFLMLPFLAQAAQLLRALGALPPRRPDASPPGDASDFAREAARLLLDLGLPPLASFVGSTDAQAPSASPEAKGSLVDTVRCWSKYGGGPSLAIGGALAPRLCTLPNDYYDVLLALSDDKAGVCARCQTKPSRPALCLSCGVVLCAISMCCKEAGEGELSRHTESCCSGAGVFLLLESSEILLVAEGMGQAYGSVYVDKNGDLDLGLIRRLALQLDPARVASLHALVARQSITQLVARMRNADPYTASRRGLY